jgi:hypothetical protein
MRQHRSACVRWRWTRGLILMGGVATAVMLAACTDGPVQASARSAGPGPHLSSYCGLPGYPPCAMDGISSGTGDYGCTSPATNIDYCQGGGSGGGMVGDGGGYGGSGEDAGGGGGGGTSPTDPAQDSCKTGSVVLDDPVIRSGLDELWRNSSPEANLGQRHEQFGWTSERQPATASSRSDREASVGSTVPSRRRPRETTPSWGSSTRTHTPSAKRSWRATRTCSCRERCTTVVRATSIAKRP